jgi:hypothetical protein
MESNDPRQLPATQTREGEHKFARRISCAPPSDSSRGSEPPRPGAHGMGQNPAGGNGR